MGRNSLTHNHDEYKVKKRKVNEVIQGGEEGGQTDLFDSKV